MLSKFSAALDQLTSGAKQQPAQSQQAAGAAASPLFLGTEEHGFSIPRGKENRHFLIGGTTGSGKTRLFLQIAAHARRRGDKAFIVDHGGEQISRFFRPGDVILNPFDARWPGWSPWNEIRMPWDADNLARSLVPDGIGSSASWNSYAQAVTAALFRRCQEEGQASFGKLIYHAIASPEDALQAFVGWNEPAVGLINPKNDKMFAGVRGIMATAFTFLRYVDDKGDFSIRDWVQNDADRRWVFITYQDSMFASLRTLISTFTSIAIMYLLDMPEDEKRRVWFLLDELGTLDKMPALVDALTKIRKRGGSIVTGLQALSQLRETYGVERATTLLANFRTWITLAAGDADTAELFSRHFGEQEVWRESFSDSASFGAGTSAGENVSSQLHEQRVLKYTELMSLPDLHGWIKLPGDAPVAPIRAPIIDYPQHTPAFIPQKKPFVHDITPPAAKAAEPVIPTFGG